MSSIVFDAFNAPKHTFDLEELHGRTVRVYVTKEAVRDQDADRLVMALHDERTGDKYIAVDVVIPKCQN